MSEILPDGFLRLNRKFFRHFLWKEERVYSRAEAWLDLMQSAAYEAQKKMVADEMIEVPRGGIVASERFLSDRWMWSRTKVRAFLNLLLAERMLTRPTNKLRNTVLILSAYEKYNPRGGAPSKNQPDTTEEPVRNQREEGIERKEPKKLLARSAEIVPSSDVSVRANDNGHDEVDALWRGHDWQGMTQDEAFSLLRGLFPNIDVWGEFTRYKELRSNKGQQPTWRPFLGWLRKATPVMNLGRTNPAKKPAPRLPAHEEWRRFIAEEYPDARDPGPARDAPASLLAEFTRWQTRSLSSTSGSNQPASSH